MFLLYYQNCRKVGNKNGNCNGGLPNSAGVIWNWRRAMHRQLSHLLDQIFGNKKLDQMNGDLESNEKLYIEIMKIDNGPCSSYKENTRRLYHSIFKITIDNRIFRE